jgi:integrase
LANVDPAFALKNELQAHRKRNYSYIKDPAVLGDLLRSIEGFRGEFATHCGLRLAPMLFLRPGELRKGEWSEVDLHKALWIIPPERLKLKKALKVDPSSEPHIVPLSKQALAILQELRAFTGNCKHMFPGARDRNRPMSDATLNAALQRLGFDTNTIQPHGFRHTASTFLNEFGFDADIVEAQLGHATRGVRGIYNKAKYLPRRHEMMQAWANYLDSLKAVR